MRKRRIHRKKWGCEFLYRNSSSFSKVVSIKQGKVVIALGLVKQLLDCVGTAYRGCWDNAKTCVVSCPDIIFGPATNCPGTPVGVSQSVIPSAGVSQSVSSACKSSLLSFRGRDIQFTSIVDSIEVSCYYSVLLTPTTNPLLTPY